MSITVEEGKTLLVDGPASVTLISGIVEVFGFHLENMGKVVIRDGKRMPFTVEKTATFNISLGENACLEEVEGSTIPLSWNKACEELLAIPSKPVTALVLGAADSGKTSFCTYLVNKLLGEKRKIAILDGDLGQSDIGPPCTVAYTFVSKPVTDLFNLEVENAFFVGVTSPSKAIDRVLQGLTFLKEEVFSSNPDFVVVNTDGWVEGEDAIHYKVQLAEKINPNIIFCIQQEGKLSPLLTALKNHRTLMIDSPLTIKQRSREKRRSLRELGYIKYLKNAKVQSIPLNWLKIKNCEQTGLSKNFGKEFTNKQVTITFKGDEKGLLAALYDNEKKFLGIGVLREINYTRKIMKIYTPVSSVISTVIIGKVRLDKNLKEIPPTPIEEKH
ncbi:MAG: Clp1/GlmU family protein [Candidatus Bathyarchaeia archaeon]